VKPSSKVGGDRLCVLDLAFGDRARGIDQDRDIGRVGYDFSAIRFAISVVPTNAAPVTLPPGRLKLATRRSATGSPL